MGVIANRWRGFAAAGAVCVIAVLLSACANEPSAPAPVYLRGAAPMSANVPSPWQGSAPPPWRENKTVTVRRGQTLADIAHANHVPERALIAANNLRPPYALHAGARLTIPDGGMTPPMQQAMAPSMPPTTLHPIPPPAPPQTVIPVPHPPIQPPPLPSSAAKVPDVVPLDGPPRPVAAAQPTLPPVAVPPAVSRDPAAPRIPPAASPSEPIPNVAGETASGRFPWPLHGRILANYGAATGGALNEGINIAAPRGTPVRSIDSGTIAYVGNEVPGYGNLVLVKHANGWISAYAHLGDVAVKKGDAVSPGEVIAKVGDTGGVGEPQLHFELRRGKKPVDPKEFLEPAGSAAAKAEQKAG